MFIFAKNTKEIVVTAGATVSLFLIGWIGVWYALLGEFYWIGSLLIFLLAIAILRGVRLGYQIGQYFFGLSALAATSTVNPLFIAHSLSWDWPDPSYLLRVLIFIFVGMAMYCCLSEHARLRSLK